LTKERDALKRGTEKLADYGALLKEKDEIIKQVRPCMHSSTGALNTCCYADHMARLCCCQVMEEGEKLAGRQAELEASLRKVRGQLKEAEAERDR
jgi:predicted ATP-dependent protease